LNTTHFFTGALSGQITRRVEARKLYKRPSTFVDQHRPQTNLTTSNSGRKNGPTSWIWVSHLNTTHFFTGALSGQITRRVEARKPYKRPSTFVDQHRPQTNLHTSNSGRKNGPTSWIYVLSQLNTTAFFHGALVGQITRRVEARKPFESPPIIFDHHRPHTNSHDSIRSQDVSPSHLDPRGLTT
jgi:uncharacterized membrane-anchored protein